MTHRADAFQWPATLDRDALRFLCAQGLTDGEIGERYGVAHGTVRSRRCRAGIRPGLGRRGRPVAKDIAMSDDRSHIDSAIKAFRLRILEWPEDEDDAVVDSFDAAGRLPPPPACRHSLVGSSMAVCERTA